MVLNFRLVIENILKYGVLLRAPPLDLQQWPKVQVRVLLIVRCCISEQRICRFHSSDGLFLFKRIAPFPSLPPLDLALLDHHDPSAHLPGPRLDH